MILRTSVAFSLIVVLISPSVDAQVVTVASTIDGPFDTGLKPPALARLTDLYNAGEWESLQRSAHAIVRTVATRAGDAGKTALDVRRNHIALTWVGSDAFGKTLVMRFVAHDPVPELFSVDLPGIYDASTDGTLYELLLTRTAEGRSTSVYVSTREKDPIEEALPGFIQAIVGPLFGTFGAIAGKEGATTTKKDEPTVFATVKRVGLPFKRASVKLKAVARDPWFDAEAFEKGARTLEAKVLFEDVPASTCGRKHMDLATKAVKAPLPLCAAQNFGACKNAIDQVLLEAYQSAVAACDGGKPPDAEAAALLLVDKRFREYVTDSLTHSGELEQTFRNRPLTTFSFGAGTAVMTSARLTEPRVKLDNGILVADPLDRVMTMAFVNWSPAGYDPDAARVSGNERVRALFGAVLTPDFGVVAGGNFLLARGIGLSVGIAVLFAKGARDEEIGAAPADSKDAYRLSVATAPFVGITYNYK